jgi:O-antigen/teichoic acid export membrane protein
MNSSNRVALNTVYLYIKTISTVFISIFYSRYLLSALGVVDFGIYNLIGGIIGLLSFITASLSNSSSKFISTSLGKNNIDDTKEVFLSVLDVSKKIVWFLVISLEIVGFIFINYVLNIPLDKVFSANILYQFMVINSAYNILTAPYSGLLFSREKIAFLSILDIIDVLIKLGIAIFLTYSSTNLLILYGFLLMVLSFINRTILKKYCKNTDVIASDLNISYFKVNKSINSDLLKFSIWSLLGSLGIIVQRQGTIFLVNIFFGVTVNAALGIASIVNNQLSNLSSSILRAFQPQIYKSFGKDDKSKQDFFTFVSSKMGVILLSFTLVPLFVETKFILSIWLIEVPKFSFLLIRFFLILTIIGHMSYGLTMAMNANGRIKEIQLLSISLQSLGILFSLFFLYIEFPLESVVILLVRLVLANKIIGINFLNYFQQIIFSPLAMIFISILINLQVSHFIESDYLSLIMVVLSNFSIIFIYSKFFLLSNEEKLVIARVKDSFFQKFKKYNST